MKRKYSILSKVGVFYLLFTLVSFLISGIILQSEANWHMKEILEKKLEQREKWIKKLIEHKPKRLKKIDFVQVTRVKQIPDQNFPVYTDTIKKNKETDRDEIHRKRVNYATIDGKTYKIEITKSAEELYRYKDDIFEVIIPVFIILSLVIVLFNYLFSGYLFAPFKFIMKQMAAYNITNKKPTKQKQTNTKEFDTLQQLFMSMQNRISKDYQQLKDYTENMSHELQTPLSIIRNKAEQLLSNENLSSEQAENLKTIYKETKQLSRLGSLLNLITKIDNREFANIQELQSKPYIEEQIEKAREFATNRNLQIQTNLDNGHFIQIDPGLFEIMLRNLLKNAIYYADENSTIKIATNQNTFTITNQGAPPPFDSKEIFNRFKRGENSKSLGLGLAIVKQICTVNNLSIHYEWEDNQHKFTITNPDFTAG